jgi:hypothetical protein
LPLAEWCRISAARLHRIPRDRFASQVELAANAATADKVRLCRWNAMPSRKKTPAPFDLVPPAPPAAPQPQLPLGGARGVQLSLEGADFAAVEAAVAELKTRFGVRFAVLSRRTSRSHSALRISATLLVRVDDALDAGTGSSSDSLASGG